MGEAYETLAAAKEGCAAVQRAADGASVVDVLPDDTEFSVVTWFGYDYWHMVMPLARLITEETVPPDVESRSPAVMR